MIESRIKYYFEKYHDDMINYALNIMGKDENIYVADVVQDAYISLINDEDRGDSPIHSLLKMKIKSSCLMILRHKSVMKKHHSKILNSSDDSWLGAMEIKSGVVAAFIKHLDDLPPARKKIVSLRYLHGYETNEIARALGISRFVVYTQCIKAMQHLKKVIIR